MKYLFCRYVKCLYLFCVGRMSSQDNLEDDAVSNYSVPTSE